MKFSLLPITVRTLLFLLLGTASLLTISCTDKEETVAKDYSGIDEEIIKKYIADNNITNARRQPSGLYYVPITTDANAAQALPGKTVSVLYTGRLMDANGTVFDATSQRNNAPFEFELGRGLVIRGWDEGIGLMRKGENGLLLIPSALAYGARGAGSIPPNAVIRFEVQLVNVK